MLSTEVCRLHVVIFMCGESYFQCSHQVMQFSYFCHYSASQPTDPALPVTLLKFCRQVAEGLSYLAGKSFVHRDIAARNILLDKELNCKVRLYGGMNLVAYHFTHKLQSSVKLSGFGMTGDLSEEEYYTIRVGRRLCIKWTAPEVLFYKKYSTSSDVWSYGMLMYEIWSLGHEPFGDSQPNQVAIGGDVHVESCLRSTNPESTVGGVYFNYMYMHT